MLGLRHDRSTCLRDRWMSYAKDLCSTFYLAVLGWFSGRTHRHPNVSRLTITVSKPVNSRLTVRARKGITNGAYVRPNPRMKAPCYLICVPDAQKKETKAKKNASNRDLRPSLLGLEPMCITTTRPASSEHSGAML